jgi:DNA repair exonuclease SbcCD ATPase subunit
MKMQAQQVTKLDKTSKLKRWAPNFPLECCSDGANDQPKASNSTIVEQQNRLRKQLEDQSISLRDELAGLGRTHAATVSQSRSEKQLLQNQIDRLQEEKDNLAHMREQAHRLSETLERKERELDDVRALLNTARERSNHRPQSSDNIPADTADSSLRDELRRQASLLSSLGKSNQALQKENNELRLRRDNVEMLNNEVKALGKKARKAEDKLAVCQEALDRARKDME